MQLPMVQRVYVEDTLVDERTTFFTVGEQRISDRLRCAKCFRFFTHRTEYQDLGNGYGRWVVISKPHCD